MTAASSRGIAQVIQSLNDSLSGEFSLSGELVYELNWSSSLGIEGMQPERVNSFTN
jgi:hypothetical protein